MEHQKLVGYADLQPAIKMCWNLSPNQGFIQESASCSNAKSILQTSDLYKSADKSNKTNAALDPSSKLSEMSRLSDLWDGQPDIYHEYH